MSARDDQIEAAAQDIAEALVWLFVGGSRPAGNAERVELLAQGLREAFNIPFVEE